MVVNGTVQSDKGLLCNVKNGFIGPMHTKDCIPVFLTSWIFNYITNQPQYEKTRDCVSDIVCCTGPY